MRTVFANKLSATERVASTPSEKYLERISKISIRVQGKACNEEKAEHTGRM